MTNSLVLYQRPSCPYCQRVLRFLGQSGIALDMRDVSLDPQAWRELLEGGGRGMVPCLRIERDGNVRWLYESLDIIDFLSREFPRKESSS